MRWMKQWRMKMKRWRMRVDYVDDEDVGDVDNDLWW